MFENGASFVVASFDAAFAEQEGDLTSYMNELARLNSVPGSWQLCKSTANWGQVQVLPPSPLCCSGTSMLPHCFDMFPQIEHSCDFPGASVWMGKQDSSLATLDIADMPMPTVPSPNFSVLMTRHVSSC